jgi:hypothetical protein
MEYCTIKQQALIKSPLDFRNLDIIYEKFHPLHESVAPGNRLIDKFPHKLSFDSPPRNTKDKHKITQTLKRMLKQITKTPFTLLRDEVFRMQMT